MLHWIRYLITNFNSISISKKFIRHIDLIYDYWNSPRRVHMACNSPKLVMSFVGNKEGGVFPSIWKFTCLIVLHIVGVIWRRLTKLVELVSLIVKIRGKVHLAQILNYEGNFDFIMARNGERKMHNAKRWLVEEEFLRFHGGRMHIIYRPWKEESMDGVTGLESLAPWNC